MQAEPYAAPEEFAADLDVIAASLADNGDADLAEGRLLDLREAVAAFGFHLAAMDVRQNSDVHERAVAELLTGGRRGSRLSGAGRRRRAPRCCWRELAHARPLRSPYRGYSDETARELAIADTAARAASALRRGRGRQLCDLQGRQRRPTCWKPRC